jgi:valyl-tRNA synthetase
VRNIRAESGADPKRRLSLVVKVTADTGADIPGVGGGRNYADALYRNEALFRRLAGVESLVCVADDDADGKISHEAMSAITHGVELFVPAEDLIDYEAERERLDRERERLEGEVKRLAGKLANEGFVSKAPAPVVDAEREKLAAAEDALAKVLSRAEQVSAK